VQALQNQLSLHCDATRDRASTPSSPMEIDNHPNFVHGNGHANGNGNIIENGKMEEDEESNDGEDEEVISDSFCIAVGGRTIPITRITDEDKELMTKEEYEVRPLSLSLSLSLILMVPSRRFSLSRPKEDGVPWSGNKGLNCSAVQLRAPCASSHISTRLPIMP